MEDLNKYVGLEVGIIEKYFRINISTVSFHKPSKWLFEDNIFLENYINTYNKKYFKEFKYISDSRMEWKEGCICQVIRENKYKKLHILTHPLSWIIQGTTLDQKIIKFIASKTKKLDTDLSKNISVYEGLF